MIKSHIYITTILSTIGLVLLASCEDGIITEDDRPIIDIVDTSDTPQRPAMANYTFIQDSIFTPTCAVSGCHNKGGGLQPVLERGEVAERIGTKYIKPGDPQGSLIIARMRERGSAAMPPPYSPFPPHPLFVVDSVAKWIEDGASLQE